jgi:hypothetical protein
LDPPVSLTSELHALTSATCAAGMFARFAAPVEEQLSLLYSALYSGLLRTDLSELVSLQTLVQPVSKETAPWVWRVL